MLYSVGEKVRVKYSGALGKVIETKYTETETTYGDSPKRIIKREYYVDYGRWSYKWFDEDQIEAVNKLTDEAAVNNFLIDINLKFRKFEMVKALKEGIE